MARCPQDSPLENSASAAAGATTSPQARLTAPVPTAPAARTGKETATRILRDLEAARTARRALERATTQALQHPPATANQDRPDHPPKVS